jgi:hypothetical protein
MSFERPDSDSMLNMNSPLNQGGYVGGGMSASDYAPTADLYMNMFKGIAEGAEKLDANIAKRKKRKFKGFTDEEVADYKDETADYLRYDKE